MKKGKRIGIILVSLIVVFVSIFLIIHYFAVYDLSGTYTAGNEPGKDNLYIVIKGNRFTIYNLEKTVATGNLEPLTFENKNDIYKINSDKDDMAGYLIHDRKNIILLGYLDAEICLKKLSNSAVYIGYEQE